MSETTQILVDGRRLVNPAGHPLNGPRHTARSLYIHVPFCAHKCHYCDFYSFVDTRDRQSAFVHALETELAWLADTCGTRRALSSVFVGGGTPSLLAPSLWTPLLEALRTLFELTPDAEFTVECNPESLTPDLADVLASGGVNRISLGAQSFHETHLRTLERRHTPGRVEDAASIVQDAGIQRCNVDLIFGIPAQTLGEWANDLDRALSLPVDHLSCYCLTYEPGTPMTSRLGRGEFEPAGDDLETELYEHCVARLRDAGYERYEVSNFARPGAECRHNLAYWRHLEWLAAGPSASGHAAGFRWKNVPRLTDWMEGVGASAGPSPVVDVEEPEPRRALCERIMMGVRLAEGLPLAPLLDEAADVGSQEPLERAIDSACAAGDLILDQGSIRPTDHGFLVADGTAATLMDAVGA